MEPIMKLLNSKADNEEWNLALRGALRSAIAGRQYPQAMVCAAGWAEHNECLFCVHKLASIGTAPGRRMRINGKTKQQEVARLDKMRYKVEATQEQIAVAPVGNLGHRIWECTADWMSKLRGHGHRRNMLSPRSSATSTDTRPGRERCSQGRPSPRSQWLGKPPSGGSSSQRAA